MAGAGQGQSEEQGHSEPRCDRAARSLLQVLRVAPAPSLCAFCLRGQSNASCVSTEPSRRSCWEELLGRPALGGTARLQPPLRLTLRSSAVPPRPSVAKASPGGRSRGQRGTSPEPQRTPRGGEALGRADTHSWTGMTQAATPLSLMPLAALLASSAAHLSYSPPVLDTCGLLSLWFP